MMANRSDRRLLTLRCVRALEAVGMSTRTRRADFHQGQGSFATPISQAGYMTATRFPLSVPHPCTRAGSIYDTTLRRSLSDGQVDQLLWVNSRPCGAPSYTLSLPPGTRLVVVEAVAIWALSSALEVEGTGVGRSRGVGWLPA